MHQILHEMLSAPYYLIKVSHSAFYYKEKLAYCYHKFCLTTIENILIILATIVPTAAFYCTPPVVTTPIIPTPSFSDQQNWPNYVVLLDTSADTNEASNPLNDRGFETVK